MPRGTAEGDTGHMSAGPGEEESRQSTAGRETEPAGKGWWSEEDTGPAGIDLAGGIGCWAGQCSAAG